MKVQISANGLGVAVPVLFQAAVGGWHSFLQALNSVANITRFALTLPSVLQHKGIPGAAGRPVLALGNPMISC